MSTLYVKSCAKKIHHDRLSCRARRMGKPPKKKVISLGILIVNSTAMVNDFHRFSDFSLLKYNTNIVIIAVHHYNYYVNAWNTSSYPRPRMSTEYGFQALPSVHSWAAVSDSLNDDDWSFNGALLSNRQHHPLGNFEMELQVSSRFGLPKSNLSTRTGLLDMMYLTQVYFKVLLI